MGIHDRILLGFIGLGVAIGVAGYVSLTTSERTLEETIGNESVDLAHATMDHMFGSIDAYLEDVQRHAWRLARHDLLRQSNDEFDRLQDANDVIRVAEEGWQSGADAARVQTITENELSQALRDDLECSDYYQERDPVYGEIFFTNKYGVNVAQTQKTSDYYQADESWWQKAKADGSYVGPIQYDESSGMYEVDVAVRLADADGRFAGVAKAVLNIRRLITALDQVRQRSNYNSTRLRLVCDDVMIYDTDNPTLRAWPLDPALLAAINQNEDREGYMEVTNEQGVKTLVAYHRVGADEPDASGSMLVLEYDRAEILAPTAGVRAQLLRVTVLLILASSLGGWILAGSISRPLTALAGMATQISRGSLDVRSNIRHSGEIGHLATAFDRMARDLRETLDHLRNEIAVRQEAEIALEAANRDLQDAIEKTERINQELRRFVYVASHDLREPLRKVTSFGGLLKQALGGKLSADDQENLDFMIDGADRMTRLIDALLVYSRVGRKEEPPGPVDLNAVIEHVQEMELGSLIEETHASIQVPEPLPVVNADSVQITQLFQNLIANGVKFRRDGVAPVITIAGRPCEDGKTVRIEVRDNGIGIDEQYRQDIFIMFKRLHSRSKYEGTGIGLAVCKKIVERHGGRIGVEAAPDHGSVFFFTLPHAERPAATTRTSMS